MNAELEKQLAELVSAAKQTGTDVASFIAQQAPDVFQQIIAWHRVNSVGGAILWTLCACVSALWFRASYTKKIDDEAVGCVFGTIGTLAFLAGTTICVLGLIKSFVAPKLVILDYVSKLL